MMEIKYNILIVEDEMLAAKKLSKLLYSSNIQVGNLDQCDSISSAIDYLKYNTDIHLIFMDIRLGDGLSFAIFEQIEIQCPIIFTTAYDEYALKAFKVNSIDYILKPILKEDLDHAINKFIRLQHTHNKVVYDYHSLVQLLKPTQYKERYLVKNGVNTIILQCSEVAYYHTEDGYTIATTMENKKHILDISLDQIQKDQDPKLFFRINRGMLVRSNTIIRFEPYFNSRTILTLQPYFKDQVIVAREKVREFKEWLEG